MHRALVTTAEDGWGREYWVRKECLVSTQRTVDHSPVGAIGTLTSRVSVAWRSGSRREESADALVRGRMRGQGSLRPTAGRALAVIQGVECGAQFQRETVVGSETVGGELAPPADRGVGKRT